MCTDRADAWRRDGAAAPGGWWSCGRGVQRLSSGALVATAVGFAAAVWLAADARTASLLRNSFLLVCGTLAIALPVGTVLGYLVARTDVPGRKAAVVVVAVMLFVPLYLQAAAWQAGFGVQGWAVLAGVCPPWVDGWLGAIWVQAMAAVPWVVLITGAGFLLVEPELEEQALLDAPPRRVFWQVSLPAAGTAIGVAAVWVGLSAAGEMTVTDLFLVRTFAEELYTRRAAMGLEPGEAFRGMLWPLAALAWAAAAGLLLWARLVPRERPATVALRPVYRLGPWRLPAAAGLWSSLALMAGVPLGNLIYKAGVTVSRTAAGPMRWWSGAKSLQMVVTSPLEHASELGWSAITSAASSTACVLLGLLLAWMASRGGWRAATVLVAAAALFVLPGPVVGLAAIGLINRPEVPVLAWLYGHSILAPWVALCARTMPLTVLVLWGALRTVPSSVLDAAATDGAGPWRRLWWVAVPGRPLALVVAWLVGFAVGVGDLAATVLTLPPGMTTLSVRIFGLLHYGVEDQVAGICLALVAMFTALVAAGGWIMRSWGSRAAGRHGRFV